MEIEIDVKCTVMSMEEARSHQSLRQERARIISRRPQSRKVKQVTKDVKVAGISQQRQGEQCLKGIIIKFVLCNGHHALS